ncbi:MAG: hypothetical protein CK424_04745 [Legionella sp.]|nr:MAG: hypothetical protein CK424_04745 [Legionella sp.]
MLYIRGPYAIFYAADHQTAPQGYWLYYQQTQNINGTHISSYVMLPYQENGQVPEYDASQEQSIEHLNGRIFYPYIGLSQHLCLTAMGRFQSEDSQTHVIIKTSTSLAEIDTPSLNKKYPTLIILDDNSCYVWGQKQYNSWTMTPIKATNYLLSFKEIDEDTLITCTLKQLQGAHHSTTYDFTTPKGYSVNFREFGQYRDNQELGTYAIQSNSDIENIKQGFDQQYLNWKIQTITHLHSTHPAEANLANILLNPASIDNFDVPQLKAIYTLLDSFSSRHHRHSIEPHWEKKCLPIIAHLFSSDITRKFEDNVEKMQLRLLLSMRIILLQNQTQGTLNSEQITQICKLYQTNIITEDNLRMFMSLLTSEQLEALTQDDLFRNTIVQYTPIDRIFVRLNILFSNLETQEHLFKEALEHISNKDMIRIIHCYDLKYLQSNFCRLLNSLSIERFQLIWFFVLFNRNHIVLALNPEKEARMLQIKKDVAIWETMIKDLQKCYLKPQWSAEQETALIKAQKNDEFLEYLSTKLFPNSWDDYGRNKVITYIKEFRPQLKSAIQPLFAQPPLQNLNRVSSETHSDAPQTNAATSSSRVPSLPRRLLKDHHHRIYCACD